MAKYIKNPSESGKSEVLDKELEKIKKNEYDPAVHHRHYMKHEAKFHH